MSTFIKTTLVESSPSPFDQGYAGPETVYHHGFQKVWTKNISEDELAVGADTKVKSADGHVGRIDDLLVDPASGSITHLRLRKGHMWAPKEVMVPITEVDRMGDQRIHLRMNRGDIEALPASAARKRYW